MSLCAAHEHSTQQEPILSDIIMARRWRRLGYTERNSHSAPSNRCELQQSSNVRQSPEVYRAVTRCPECDEGPVTRDQTTCKPHCAAKHLIIQTQRGLTNNEEAFNWNTMSTRRMIRDIIEATRDHISTMSGRYRISPLDFDELYQLYQEDTSAKGLFEFIVDHPITHSISGRLNVRPIDVLATMVGKTADACQQELNAEIDMHQAAENRAAETRQKAEAR
ncbi:hypothetical protein F4677DRAFT_269901 [Hypoxylon crocopeplum]|nr:hypothetical protein F4677DRAFT_269901 [Hypoxylon crocopeplum]